MMQSKQLKIFLLLASFAFLIMLGGILIYIEGISPEGQIVAHHMAPVDYNVTVGQLNLDMVHHGFYTGVMPVAPDVGGGNLNRQLWENPPTMP